MKTFAIHWSMHGTTVIQAPDRGTALEIFNELPDIENDRDEEEINEVEEVVYE